MQLIFINQWFRLQLKRPKQIGTTAMNLAKKYIEMKIISANSYALVYRRPESLRIYLKCIAGFESSAMNSASIR
jgi:hypothetical protein